MGEFFNVLPPDEALELLLSHLNLQIKSEEIAVFDALDRVTAVAIEAPHSLPEFRRSTMDGYAVRAADTFGATEGLPGLLHLVGEIPMGKAATIELGKGEAAIVHTGGMIPETADAVIQIEHTEQVSDKEIELWRSVAVGQNILQVGEDVAQGKMILPSGHKIRPEDIGGLLALGICTVAVVRQPRVGILATGDELIEPHQSSSMGEVRDINSYTIGALTRQAGGIPIMKGIIPDQLELLEKAASDCLEEVDMLVMSAGSSVSVRDMTGLVLDQLGEPGVLLHGIAIKPGKPTIIGVAQGKPVLGLPGNPVSAMILYRLLGMALIRLMLGEKRPLGDRFLARLTENIASETGREDYIPIRLEQDGEEWLATPVFGKSNLIYTLVNADGLIKIPLNKNGLLAGEQVAVLF